MKNLTCLHAVTATSLLEAYEKIPDKVWSELCEKRPKEDAWPMIKTITMELTGTQGEYDSHSNKVTISWSIRSYVVYED